jgi:hypothetical protein
MKEVKRTGEDGRGRKTTRFEKEIVRDERGRR